MGLMGEFWLYMRERKKWWLLPVIVVMWHSLAAHLRQGLGARAVHLHDLLAGNVNDSCCSW